MIKFKIILPALLIIGLIVLGCGEKKTDTTTKKDGDNTTMTQNNTTTQTQQTTQKKDSVVPKTDTVKTTEKTSKKVIMETSMGNIEIELDEVNAPNHAANFKKLVDSKFYEGTTFHRVMKDFMIQGGDPNSKDSDKSNDGLGGPGYTVKAEIKVKHEKGSLAAARLGDAQNPNRESSGSQFYIVTGSASHLDGQYTVFGKVTKGMDIANKIQNVKTDERDNPVDKVVIKKVYFAK